MKLTDIFDIQFLQETLDNPFPVKYIRPGICRIEIDDQHAIDIVYHVTEIQQYKCLALAFINPNVAKHKRYNLTNVFNGPGAVRVLSTIVSVVEKLDFDLVFFTPDDIDVNVVNRKTKLYRVVMNKLQRIGMLLSYHVIEVEQHDVFVGVKTPNALSEQDLIDIATKFAIYKNMM